MGLYYYRTRYYSPGMGRFIAEDTLGDDERLANMMKLRDDVNLYTYAMNNPTRWTDPYGTQPKPSPRFPWTNGNFLPGWRPQDQVCSVWAFSGRFNERECVKNCCNGHDACYTEYGCNLSSFLTTTALPCNVCNYRAVRCMLTAWAMPPRSPKCECPKY